MSEVEAIQLRQQQKKNSQTNYLVFTIMALKKTEPSERVCESSTVVMFLLMISFISTECLSVFIKNKCLHIDANQLKNYGKQSSVRH